MASALFIATVIRVGLVVISYGCKVPCGIFVPSMAVGATFGRMVGIAVKALEQYVFPDSVGIVAHNLYAERTRVLEFSPFVSLTFHASHLEHTRSWGPQQLLGESYHRCCLGEPDREACCSGVMRITVTVVVIMFELTGALTYILPTMVGN